MDEIRMRARLIDPEASGFAGRGHTTVVPRQELEEVLACGEYPADLLLDVARRSGEGEREEHSEIAVSWDETALTDALAAAGEDDVLLWFDEADLERAIEESEVAAHGLRERTAVLTIAVAAAGATAGGAFAQTGATSPFLRNVAVPDYVSSSATGGVEASVSSGSAAPEAAVSPFLGGVAVPDGGVAGSARGVEAAVSGDQAPPEAAVSPFLGGVAVPDGAPSFRESGPGSVSASSNVAADEAVSSSASATSAGSFQPSPGEDAGIAAGVAMLIAGAGFALVRSRQRPERPA